MPLKRLDEYLRRSGDRLSSAVDIESVLRRLAELIVEEAMGRSGACDDSLVEAVRSLEDRFKRVEEALNNIARELDELKDMVKRIDVVAKPAGLREQQKMPKWLTTLVKILEENGGYRLASQLPREIVDGYDKAVAERHGIHMLDIGGDILFAKREVLENLVTSVSNINVGDEAAVAAKLGGKLSKLFMLLRRGGYLVYSASRKGWIPVDELKRILSLQS